MEKDYEKLSQLAYPFVCEMQKQAIDKVQISLERQEDGKIIARFDDLTNFEKGDVLIERSSIPAADVIGG